jgi:hypothetical protein
MAKESYKLVLIEWEDSHGCSPEWVFIDKCNPSRVVCQSVGWLIYDGKDCKVIVPHLTHSTHVRRQGCGDMTIPTSAVLRVISLSESKRSRKRV